MRERFRDYSGGVYDRPDVHVAVEDGRSFVRRSPRAVRHHPGVARGHLGGDRRRRVSLSENSLYTVEAFDDYLDHLSDRGVLSISRWVFDGLRLISLAQEAGARRGWDPADRLAIIQHDKVATFLLKKTPFTRGGEQDPADAAAQPRLRGALSARTAERTTFGDNRDDYARLLHAPDRQRLLPRIPARRHADDRRPAVLLSHDASCATTRSSRRSCACSARTSSARSTRARGRPAA